MKKMTKFTELGLEKKLLDTIDAAGFSIPFPIQERTIPILLAENDVIGQAHTGTGKTAACTSNITEDNCKTRNPGNCNGTYKRTCITNNN